MAISTTRRRCRSNVPASPSARASCIFRAVRSNRRDSMSSVSISLGRPATSLCRTSTSDAVSCSHDSGCRKRSTASSCIRTMKFSRFIAATSRWSSVANASASAPSGSRSGAARTSVSNCTRVRKSRAWRGAWSRFSIPSGCSRKKSKLKQKSKTRKSCLSSPGPNRIGAEPRAAPDHLPELDPRVDRLEEDQVGHLGHVDARIEHVHGDRDVRRLVLP